MTLTTSNLDSMKEGIPLTQLPKSFQEAIRVAQNLGIGYLWIDSLCIIQSGDDYKDWKVQASMMGDVYQHAIVNIAATSSKHSGEGLFRNRNVEHLRETIIAVARDWSGGLEPGEYRLIHSGMWTENLDRSPLLQRGWVFQERVLSKRMLHFGAKQIMWECASLQASETFPEGEAKNDPEKSVKTTLNKMQLYSKVGTRTRLIGLERISGNLLYKLWRDLVAQYSQCGLTREKEDKLVALSGLASKVSTFLGATDIYLAGIWKNDLCTGLLWFKLTPLDGIGRTPASRMVDSATPSWSWASITGRVLLHPEVFAGEDLVEIEDLGTSLSTQENRFGQVSEGHITLWGCLTSTEVVAATHTSTSMRYVITILQPGFSTPCLGTFYPDDIGEYNPRRMQGPPGDTVICLPLKLCILGPDKDPLIAGVAVKYIKTDRGRNFYKRTGMFTGVRGKGIDTYYVLSKREVVTLI